MKSSNNEEQQAPCLPALAVAERTGDQPDEFAQASAASGNVGGSPLQSIEEMTDIAIQSSARYEELREILRLIDDRTIHDDQIDADNIYVKVADDEEDEEIAVHADINWLTPEHLATHLPKCAQCPG